MNSTTRFTNYAALKIFCVLLAGVVISLTSAKCLASELMIKDGASVQFDISDKWPTRIQILEGRITDIYHENEDVEFRASEERGDVQVIIKNDLKGPIEFSFNDDRGNSVQVTARIKKIPPRTVSFKYPVEDQIQRETPASNRETTKDKIKFLMKALANRTAKAGNWSKPDNSEIERVANCKVKLVRVLERGNLIGEVYTLVNASDQVLKLDEIQFTVIGENIQAIALSKRDLAPRQRTELYIVRSRGGR